MNIEEYLIIQIIDNIKNTKNNYLLENKNINEFLKEKNISFEDIYIKFNYFIKIMPLKNIKLDFSNSVWFNLPENILNK